MCARRAAELRDEALFKDPPGWRTVKFASYQCQEKIYLVYHFHPRLYPIPIYDYAESNEELASKVTEVFMNVVGMSICSGCIPSFCASGIEEKSFCNAVRKKLQQMKSI
jgi:hypothetical protein